MRKIMSSTTHIKLSSFTGLEQFVEEKNFEPCVGYSGKTQFFSKASNTGFYISDLTNNLAQLCFNQPNNCERHKFRSVNEITSAQNILKKLKTAHETALKNLQNRSYVHYGISSICTKLDYYLYQDKARIDQLEKALKKTEKEVRQAVYSKILKDPLSKKVRGMSNTDVHGNCGGVYIGTNEDNLEKTRELIQNNLKKIEGGTHIGFSSWHNFDLVFETKSSRAVLCDFNPNTKIFMDETLRILCESSNRLEFVNSMVLFLKDYEDVLGIDPNAKYIVDETRALWAFKYTCAEEIELEMTREGSWLASDEGFNYLRNLAQNDKIATFTENAMSYAVFEKLSKLLRDNDCMVSSVYLSNIIQYCNNRNISSFLKTAEHLIGENTVVIACLQFGEFHKDNKQLVQNAVLGKDCKGDLSGYFVRPTTVS